VHPIGKSVAGVQTIETLSSLVREIEADTERVTKFLARRTERTPPSQWRELMSKSHVISPDEAVEIGLAHRIDEWLIALGWEICCCGAGEEGHASLSSR
jgi:ATP-dependent protease ClpP protease subunit